jgi:hypothetical protein
VHQTVPQRRSAPAERHEPWCDRRQHALAGSETVTPSGCVGRYVEHGAAGGWIADEAPESDPRLVLDWQPADGWTSMTPEEAADLSGLLARLMAEYRRGARTGGAPLSMASSRRPAARTRRKTA